MTLYDNNREDEERDVKADEIMDRPFLAADKESALPAIILGCLKPHICRDHLDAAESFQRQEIWDYPPLALRELIANAFAHRDWTKQSQTTIAVYADCLEIASPGALPNGMTVEKAKAGLQIPRNNVMLRILRNFRFIEDLGMGIRRRVIPAMLREGGREPLFEATEDYFRVVLPKRAAAGGV